MTTGAVMLVLAAFLASAVEAVEALTVVLAVGVTRGWRAALLGAGTAALALVHAPIPRLGTDVVTALSHRAPFRHGRLSVSGLMCWGTNRVFLVTVEQDGRGASARWTIKGTYRGDQISLSIEGQQP